VTGDIRFGLWGYCVSPITASVGIVSHSTQAFCNRGFQIDPTLASILGIGNADHDINSTLNAILSFHPLTCGLLFVALVATLYWMFNPETHARLVRMIIAFSIGLAVFFGTIALIIDGIVIGEGGKVLRKLSDKTLSVSPGNAFWLSLVTVVLLYIVLFKEVCGRCQFKSFRHARSERLVDSPRRQMQEI